ncbi:hypothetical protein [Pendulispora albinea]|uniref:Uncharacterized protein n=1 Tax=Pendulispora albinea TaxID=2741071 RepID=A0ABZ2LMB3_9BACT
MPNTSQSDQRDKQQRQQDGASRDPSRSGGPQSGAQLRRPESKDAGAAPEGAEQPNEGEGSRTGARAYDAATEKYIRSGKVEKAAQEAKRAVDGEEGEELREAEKEGRSHAKEDD